MAFGLDNRDGSPISSLSVYVAVGLSIHCPMDLEYPFITTQCYCIECYCSICSSSSRYLYHLLPSRKLVPSLPTVHLIPQQPITSQSPLTPTPTLYHSNSNQHASCRQD